MTTVLAVDAGNSKTDVALVSGSGEVLSWVRGGGFHPVGARLPRAIAGLSALVRHAVAASAGGFAASPGDYGAASSPGGYGVGHERDTSVGHERGYVADYVAAFLAHCDLPVEQKLLEEAVAAEGWAPALTVDNDAFALLRAGSGRPYGVAVVCGGGLNCVAQAPDGTVARYPAFGRRSGDWGGGEFLGEEVLWWAVRDEDGRGPRTTLRQAVAAHFGLPSVTSVCIAFHLGDLPEERLHELAPVLFAAADAGDEVAIALVERAGDEIGAMASAAMSRLSWGGTAVPIVLGGGILTARHPRLQSRVEKALPDADLHILEDPPILGAALHGLDRLGLTTPTLESHLRTNFTTHHPTPAP